MSQEAIGQRLKFLMDSLNLKVRTFANALDVSETNIRNYTTRDSKPSSDIIERIVRQYPQVNTHWLVTGEGKPFLPTTPSDQSTTINAKKNSGNIQSNTGDHATNTITTNVQLEDCRRDLDKATSEVKHLQAQLAAKDDVIASKNALIASQAETLSLLRGSHNRPN